MIKPLPALFISSGMAVWLLGHLESLQYPAEGRPDFDLMELLFMTIFAFIPATIALVSTRAPNFATLRSWQRAATATVICAAIFTLGFSIFPGMFDEYLDAMDASEITSPLFFFAYLFATYSIPCAIITYSLTALYCKFTGTKLFTPPKS